MELLISRLSKVEVQHGIFKRNETLLPRNRAHRICGWFPSFCGHPTTPSRKLTSQAAFQKRRGRASKAAARRNALVRTIQSRASPIFDERLKIFAYELLFRAGPQNIFQARKDASSSVIVDSATLFDLQTLTGHAKAFINVDEARDSQRRGPAAPREPHRRGDTRDRCANRGGRQGPARNFASLDTPWLLMISWSIPNGSPLLRMVKFLKVDFSRHGTAGARGAICQAPPIEWRAPAGRKKWENARRHEASAQHGVLFFSKVSFFCKPVMVEGKGHSGK